MSDGDGGGKDPDVERAEQLIDEWSDWLGDWLRTTVADSGESGQDGKQSR